MIKIHFDFTDGTELSYQEGLAKGDDFSTCCLDFFSFDTNASDVIVYKKNGHYISRNQLLDGSYKYCDKEIRVEHNIQKMLKADTFFWAIPDDLKDLSVILREEEDKRKLNWNKVKDELNGLIDPKYFIFAENHESFNSEGFVNIIEVVEKTSGYNSYPHCREFGTKDTRLYIKHECELETDDEKSPYNGEKIEYWVWQTSGPLGDDYSGYILMPMNDGRYWKISYTC